MICKQLSQFPGQFRDYTKFSYEVWVREIATPLLRAFARPPNHTNESLKRFQTNDLDIMNRILRWHLLMTGIPFRAIVTDFRQSKSTCSRDLRHGCLAFLEVFGEQWLKHIEVGSEEYNEKKGSGCFENFPNALYAADVTKVCTQTCLQVNSNFC